MEFNLTEIEQSRLDLDDITALKKVAIKLQMYPDAANLRDLEKEIIENIFKKSNSKILFKKSLDIR